MYVCLLAGSYKVHPDIRSQSEQVWLVMGRLPRTGVFTAKALYVKKSIFSHRKGFFCATGLEGKRCASRPCRSGHFWLQGPNGTQYRYDAITTLRRPLRGPKHGSIDCTIVCMQLSGQTRRASRNRHDQTPPPVATGHAKSMDS